MTLVLGLRCVDGVVIASDSARSVGRDNLGAGVLTSPMTKVLAIREFVYGWAGAEDVAQHFAMLLGRARDVTAAQDRFECWKSLQQLLNKAIAESGSSDATEVLIGWCAGDTPTLAHLRSIGRKTLAEDADYIGERRACEAAQFGMQVLRFFADPREITAAQGQIVAYKAVTDVIEIGLRGVGLGTQVGYVDGGGAVALSRPELRALQDTALVWGEQCRGLLGEAEHIPSHTDTPERGVPRPNEP